MNKNRVVINQYRKFISENNPLVKICLGSDIENAESSKTTSSNFTIWYLLISDLNGEDDEFTTNGENREYGEYVVRMEIPDSYPFDPPSFYFMTENGIFSVERKVCMSAQHLQNYNLCQIVECMVSYLINWKDLDDPHEVTNVQEKKELARRSKDMNKYIKNEIKKSYESYSARWKK